ncbi:hypothetical protein HNO88_001874 [Novosphingobium chloroacetimidivorans]|uniref:PilZ domain-containing protein n=1 Tax=Novosphingobium chloroacetimidivorans TaxID=1428314 RepID=A0A7W7K983_9SPHN|nr:PilZ domain-containing protein [Novosphingobium chloroacetimidivorans]MBB4858551.1 hypothetical protein [Novosphingobium chloroacetimidivorans]
MAAPLRNLHVPPAPKERRGDTRQALRGLATLSQAGVERCEAALSDVSPYGCCVAITGEWLRPGHFVTITLPGMRPLSAIVRWAHSGAAGLELLQRLACDEPEWVALID